jgi:hypothetical protein
LGRWFRRQRKIHQPTKRVFVNTFKKKEEVMKLPKQVPAVERKVNKEAALPVGAKVCPAGFWDFVKKALPVIATIAGAA